MKKTRLDYIYVGIQFVLFAVYSIPVTILSFSSGLVLKILGVSLFTLGVLMGLLSVIQLNKNLSPFPTPIAGGQLIETGLYKYIRHPIYTSILFTLSGYGLYRGEGYKICITFVLFILFFFKSKYEEKKLSLVFSDYPGFIKRTSRFLPKIIKKN